MSFMANKMAFLKFVFTFLMMFGLIVFGQAQELSEQVEDLYNRSEQVYSTDDLLVNGQIYIPARPRAKGSPYFGGKQFVEGSVQIKGRQFKGVLLKYNLENQRIILRAALESGKYVTILLNSNLIDHFTIDGQYFINAVSFFEDLEVSGFYTLVYEGNFTFLVKYEKTFRAVYDNQTPEGSYTELHSDFFIFEDGKLENITKKKALLNYFPLHKKEIKSFMRKYKIQYKKASVTELNQLMNYCDTISANK